MCRVISEDIREMKCLQYSPSSGNWHLGSVKSMFRDNTDAFIKGHDYDWICLGIFHNYAEADFFLEIIQEDKEGNKVGSSIYFIEAIGVEKIKIGVTTNIEERLNTLKTGSPVELKLLGVIPGGQESEKNIHDRLSAYRANGEWFFASTDVMEYIRKKLSGHGVKPEA
ncbi:hypothetical protein LCGC14_1944980 [marine sediment metagenome]